MQELTQEKWMAYGQPGRDPRSTYEGKTAEGVPLPEPTIERYGDGSALVRAWGTGRESAEEAWRAAVAELDETATGDTTTT